jgi:MscS family membrane protein
MTDHPQELRRRREVEVRISHPIAEHVPRPAPCYPSLMIDRPTTGRTSPGPGRHLAASARVAFLTVGAAFAALALTASAQTPALPAPTATPAPHALAEARTTPRDTLAGFLAAGEEGDFSASVYYLDLTGIPVSRHATEGARLARRLYLVFLHLGVDPESASSAPLGSAPADAERREETIVAVSAFGREIPIVLARRADGDGPGSWLISSQTVASVDALYRAHGYAWIGDHLPSFFFALRFLGIQLYQWLSLAVALVFGYAIARGLARVLLIALGAVARRTSVLWDNALVKALDGPLAIVLWGVTLTATAAWAGLPTSAAAVSRVAWRLLTVSGIGWLLFRAWDGVVGRMRDRADQANQVTLGYIPVIARSGQVFIALVVALAGLDVIGVNVMTMVAGLGIGGVAIAFAAQKTIENVFGAATIAGDRPFNVGDYITAAGSSGTVEEIGLRSTRIRTLDRMLVTIPNGLLAAGTIINLTSRDRFIFNPTFGVRYETTADQLTFIVDEIRKALIVHPRVFQDSHRARFSGFGPSSLNVEIMAWVVAADYHEYTATAEELNFTIARIVERAGTSFAFPSQTLYLGSDTHPAPERAAEIAREVASRRERGVLAVPEPRPGLAETLRGQNDTDPTTP